MKIAFVNITYGLVSRGAETFVRELSERFSENDDVEIFSGHKIPPRRWPFLWRLGLDPNSLSILFFSLRVFPKVVTGKFDFVFAVDGMWEALLMRLATWISGAKLVISGQSGSGFDDRVNTFSFPDAFVAITEVARAWAKRVNPFVKSIYIPNGVDTVKFSPNGSTYKTSFTNTKPVVLSVAAMSPNKRLDLVINAVAKSDRFNLLLVGDGELKSEINKLGDRLLGSRFELTQMNFSDIPSIYRSADVFAFVPSRSESFGIVYLEAMATGLPVVAIDDAKRREIVGTAGVFVEKPEDPDELLHAIEVAMDGDYKKHSISDASQFSWDKIELEYRKLFNSLI